MHFPSCLLGEYVFPRLSALDVVRFSQTDKLNYASVSDYTVYAFSITKILGRYFTPDQIIAFRILQSQTDAVISGSTAVQFFDRTYYPESDLDIYVSYENSGPLINWLLDIEYLPEEKRRRKKPMPLNLDIQKEYRFSAGVKGIHTFLKTYEGKKKKIQVMTTLASPCEAILLFHSTCVMNFITHSTAYSLFPYATIMQRRSLLNERLTQTRSDVKAALKYRHRGWQQFTTYSFRFSSEREDTRSDFYSPKYGDDLNSIRYLGDNRCWTVQLHPKIEEIQPDSLAYSTSWRLEVDAPESVMGFNLLMSPVLETQYVIAEALVPYLKPIVTKLERENRTKCDRRLQDLLRAYFELILE